MIENIVREVEIDDEFDGTVTRVEGYGMFVEYLPGREGLVHVSNMSSDYVKDANDLYKVGDSVHVRVKEYNPEGKVALTMLSKEQEAEAKAARAARGESDDNGRGRGGNGGNGGRGGFGGGRRFGGDRGGDRRGGFGSSIKAIWKRKIILFKKFLIYTDKSLLNLEQLLERTEFQLKIYCLKKIIDRK